MPGLFECLVLVCWTGIWIEHTQGKRSDLSPQETALMDSAARMAEPLSVGEDLRDGRRA